MRGRNSQKDNVECFGRSEMTEWGGGEKRGGNEVKGGKEFALVPETGIPSHVPIRSGSSRLTDNEKR